MSSSQGHDMKSVLYLEDWCTVDKVNVVHNSRFWLLGVVARRRGPKQLRALLIPNITSFEVPPTLPPPRSLTCTRDFCCTVTLGSPYHLSQCFYNPLTDLLDRVQSRAAPHSFSGSGCQSLDDTFIWQQYHYHPCLTLYPPCRVGECLCPVIPMLPTRPTGRSLPLLFRSRNAPMQQHSVKTHTVGNRPRRSRM